MNVIVLGARGGADHVLDGVRTAAAPGDPRPPALVLLLHDGAPVHAPEDVADRVAEAAAEAGRLVLGEMPVDFALSAWLLARA